MGGFLKKCFSNVEIICLCFISILLLLSVNTILNVSGEISLVLHYLAFTVITVIIAYMLRRFLKESKLYLRVLFVMTVAFIIRGIVCYYLNLTQKGDYGIYLAIAEKIGNGTFKPSIYYGIFPHALNYPIFLSDIYKLTGNFSWTPRLINLITGVIEAGGIAIIAEKSINKTFGLICGLAVSLNPSVILFTLFSGGEPVYGSLIIISLMCLAFSYKGKAGMYLFFIAVSGVFCALGNFFRPTGIILIIAALIIFFIFDAFAFKIKLVRAITIVAAYLLVSFMLGQYTYSIRGYEKPSHSYGWNLFIGANAESKGRWNAADAELFNIKAKEYKDPSEIQSYFARSGFQRYMEMKTGVLKHFANKICMWLDEKFIVSSVTGWQNEYTRFKSSDIPQAFNLICFFYNFILVTGSLTAMVLLTRDKNPAPCLKLASLYLLGSIFVFLLLETAARYKGAYYSMFTLMGMYGIRLVYLKYIRGWLSVTL